MIPQAYVTAWREQAPWTQDAQVEQDLVITRALVEIFSDSHLAESLAFRGGTALSKLYLTPATRYSEDIDLVQARQEPIGPTLDRLRAVLDPWLGKASHKLKKGRVVLRYQFDSEDSPPIKLRLKLEINSREHFTELGYARVPFSVDNPWFSGDAELRTFHLEELLGTKLRALHQRSKGRDLFDLWYALENHSVDPKTIVRCFERYMREGGHEASRAEVEASLDTKSRDRDFRDDIVPLLRPNVEWDFDTALNVVRDRLVAKLRGAPWKGPGAQ